MVAMLLFRPVGLNELRLIVDAKFRAFPPRLPEQPIFYPVLNVEYARQIARDWNTKDEPYAGFVTRFDIDDSYAVRFEVQTVGARMHRELWVPAEELDAFNSKLTGPIEVIEYFTGPKFAGSIDPATRLPAGWRTT
jgi:hypothetical protein